MLHVLGLLTLLSQIVLGGWVAVYLTRVGNRPYTWQRPMRVPRVVEFHLTSGSDYVGFI